MCVYDIYIYVCMILFSIYTLISFRSELLTTNIFDGF